MNKFLETIGKGLGFIFGVFTLPFVLFGENLKKRWKMLISFLIGGIVVQLATGNFWLSVTVGFLYSLFVLGVLLIVDEYKEKIDNQ